jgi:hypothetical protein
MIDENYVLTDKERESFSNHGWDPDLVEKIIIRGNRISLWYDGMSFINKIGPGNSNDYGNLIGRRLHLWISNPNHS